MKASTIAENGDVQPDDVITKDMPSDLMSTVAEDSNASLQFKKSWIYVIQIFNNK